MMLTPGPRKDKKKKDYDPFMLLAKYKGGGKSAPKKQLGGLGNMFGIDTGTLNGIMSGLEGVDFNDFQSVVSAGEKIGGQNFLSAMSYDDPSKIGGLKEMSAALAQSQKPVWTPGTPEYNAEFDRRVAERGVDTIPNGRDRVRIKSMIHEEMKREGQRNAQFGQGMQTINNMVDATGQAAGMNSLLGLLDSFQFQRGGMLVTPEDVMRLKMQLGDESRPFLERAEGVISPEDLSIWNKAETSATPKLANKEFPRRLLQEGIQETEAYLAAQGKLSDASWMDMRPDVELVLLSDQEKAKRLGYKGIADFQKKTKTPKSQTNAELRGMYLRALARDLVARHQTQDIPKGKGVTPTETAQFAGGGLMTLLGYSDNSPYKNLPAINIPGNNITMANTGKPILAIPDAGQPAVMAPYSGTHVFPGATNVLEIPMPKKKKGGKGAKKWTYQMGGPGLSIGAQLEQGELFATPNADIIDTNAKELHKDMPNDLVTDILGPEDYVFSALPSHKITRKQAEELSDKVGGVLYEEGKIKELPKTYGPIDFFRDGEKEINVAEFVKRVRAKYKVRPEEADDPFVRKTNAANKESRIPHLQAAAAANEMKRGGNEMSGYASTFENKFKDSPLADALPVRRAGTYAAFDSTEQVQQAMEQAAEGEPTQMQGGGLFGPIMAGVQFLGGIFGGINQNNISRNNYNTIRKALTNDRQEIDKLAKTQSAFNVASAVPVLGALAAQNPTVDAIKSDTSQLDATVRRMPRSYFDMAMARLTANNRPYLSALANNASNFGQIVAGAAPVVAANATAMANMGMQEAQQNIQMENAYRAQKQQYLDRDIANEVAARNATRSNSNTLLSGLGATLSGTVARQGSIETDKINAIRDNRMQLAQAEMNRRSQRGQAFNQILGGASQAANTLYSDALLRNADGSVSQRSTGYQVPADKIAEANAKMAEAFPRKEIPFTGPGVVGRDWQPPLALDNRTALPLAQIQTIPEIRPYGGPMIYDNWYVNPVQPVPSLPLSPLPIAQPQIPPVPTFTYDSAMYPFPKKKGGKITKSRK